MDYPAEFYRANELRSALGLIPFKLSPSNKHRVLDDGAELCDAIRSVTEKFQAADFAFQCLTIHRHLMPHVAVHLGCDVIFTLGYVEIEGNSVFKFSVDDLKRWRDSGVPSFNSVEMHAWLTLPSMEILDFTFGSSAAKVRKDPRLDGIIVARHFSKLVGLRYCPIVLGDDVLKIVGAELSL